jgi:hypothetical protein
MAINNIQVGDIVLYSGTKLLPRLIQLFQKRKWNHAGLVVEFEGKLMILEAVAEGAVLRLPEESFAGSQIMIMRPRFEIKDLDGFSKMAIELVLGKPYDYASLLWHQLIFKLSGRRKWVGRRHTAYMKLNCSELVAYVYDMMYGVFPIWHKTSPAMIRENEVDFEPIKNFPTIEEGDVVEHETTDEPLVSDESSN